MDKIPYPVGTVCRVRSEEDMIAEFGSLSNYARGNIYSSKMDRTKRYKSSNDSVLVA